jgi:hypothetical protein
MRLRHLPQSKSAFFPHIFASLPHVTAFFLFFFSSPRNALCRAPSVPAAAGNVKCERRGRMFFRRSLPSRKRSKCADGRGIKEEEEDPLTGVTGCEGALLIGREGIGNWKKSVFLFLTLPKLNLGCGGKEIWWKELGGHKNRKPTAAASERCGCFILRVGGSRGERTNSSQFQPALPNSLHRLSWKFSSSDLDFPLKKKNNIYHFTSNTTRTEIIKSNSIFLHKTASIKK